MGAGLTLEIARKRFRVEADDCQLVDELQGRYADFIVDRGEDVTIKVCMRKKPGMEFSGRSCGAGLAGGSYAMRLPDVNGRVDLHIGTGSVTVDPSDAAGSLNNFLRGLWLCVFMEGPGMVLHAASIVRERKCYVFVGPSGSGKSTVARLSHGCVVLSDETTAVELLPDGVWAYPTPFRMVTHMKTSGSRRFAVSGVYILQQASYNMIGHVSPASAAAEVMAVPAIDGLADREGSFRKYCELFERVRCGRLHFSLDGGFWNTIESERLARSA